MKYRKELQRVLGKQFLFEATLLRNGYMKFTKDNLGLVDIETQLHIPAVRIYPEKYYKTPISRVDKTTLLTDVKINNLVIDHIWIPCNLIGNDSVGKTKQYIGQLYTYERENGTLDYGIKILGVPIK